MFSRRGGTYGWKKGDDAKISVLSKEAGTLDERGRISPCRCQM